ncbi:MAG: extracellular solute-binding protein [Verrucomicrobia bacterium]|nr:extracellular solute-binding protein [Verrucomicrobiota bacterium]
MWKPALIVLLLAATIALPFALRPKQQAVSRADDRLVVITPHNEAIRQEFARAFALWYRERTGRTVAIDWRLIGGTSEIARFIEGEYAASFQNHWVNTLHHPWSNEVLNGFSNGRLPADASVEAREAREAFLASQVGCGIDLFFGGGAYDFIRQAQAGRLVDSGIVQKHPEWFNEAVIPRTFAGEEYWDTGGRWVGVVLGSFGIVANGDSLHRLGIGQIPRRWEDLRDPRFIGEIALADPTKSGSSAKAFENVVQQQMQKHLLALQTARPAVTSAELERQAVAEGWTEGMRLLQAIGANARYFTDSAQKVPVDVAAGDCAAGMCIDFYGRQQQEAVRRRGGDDRVSYVSAEGGAVASVDPIALMRGAPNPAAARAFIEFTLSMEGQKLWNLRPGTPGGPAYFALRRLPVRKDFYALPGIETLRSDPEELPYAGADQLIYRPAWTGKLFRELSFAIRVMCLDTQPELKRAWRALADAGMPPEALAVFQDISAVDYEAANGRIKAALTSKNKVDEIRLAGELAAHFRRQYLRAEELAKAGR